MQGVRVQSLVRELRSHMPWGAAIRKEKKSEAILAENFERDIFYSKGQEDGQNIWNKCQQYLVHRKNEYLN